MDGTKFDGLTRTIAQRLSRRLTFKALVAGLTAGTVSQLDVEPADAARCRKLGQTCRKRRGKPRPRCCAGSVCRGNRCQCKPGRKKCGNKCITRKQCCRNNQCPNNQRCDKKTNRCGCGKNQKRCQGRCIAKSQCCTNVDCPSNQVCTDQGQCVVQTCEENADCRNGTCVCGPTPDEVDVCLAPTFVQTFQTNLDGWYTYTGTGSFLPPETDDVMTLDNGAAVIKPGIFDPAGEPTAMSPLGGYSNVWPEGGFTTELDIYLDTEFPDPGTHFSYDVGVRSTSCSLQNEFMMNGGTGSGENAGKYCVSGADGGAATNPCTYDDHYEVTTSGWYRFRHEFRNNGGTLQVTMKLLDTNNKELASWVAENDADTIGPGGDVGGNAFQWFPRQHFPDGLRIRNSRRTTHF